MGDRAGDGLRFALGVATEKAVDGISAEILATDGVVEVTIESVEPRSEHPSGLDVARVVSDAAEWLGYTVVLRVVVERAAEDAYAAVRAKIKAMIEDDEDVSDGRDHTGYL